MGGGESNILKEWFVGLGECLDLAGGLHAYPVGVVIVFFVDLGELGVAGQSIGVEEGTGPGHGAIEVVETALDGAVLGRISAEVPLAHHTGLVAGRLEELGDGDLAVAEAIAVYATKKRGPGRPATGGVVELGKAKAVGRKSIEVGRFNFTTEAAEVGKAHVIGHDQDDVGWSCGFSSCE